MAIVVCYGNLPLLVALFFTLSSKLHTYTIIIIDYTVKQQMHGTKA